MGAVWVISAEGLLLPVQSICESKFKWQDSESRYSALIAEEICISSHLDR